MSHRTQIIYLADASFIITALGLKPGLTVIECGTRSWLTLGTGSASFSHHILRAIAPHGHLYTYEFHKERAEAASKELMLHGMGKDLVDVIPGKPGNIPLI